jgi:prolyl-tRNA editing enzyme YbaK/EbsC (Cys-tRNA(Pro) deacylase)
MGTTGSPYHKCVDKIRSLIEQNGMWYEYMEHEPVRTSEEAARVRPHEYTLSQGAKALIVRIKEYGGPKYFAMLVVPGNLKFNYEKTKELLNAKDIRFATEEEVGKFTEGIRVGGVPPFGNLFGLKVLADKKVFEQEKIIFNAGDKRVSIALHTQDYKKLVEPEIVEIT